MSIFEVVTYITEETTDLARTYLPTSMFILPKISKLKK